MEVQLQGQAQGAVFIPQLESAEKTLRHGRRPGMESRHVHITVLAAVFEPQCSPVLQPNWWAPGHLAAWSLPAAKVSCRASRGFEPQTKTVQRMCLCGKKMMTQAQTYPTTITGVGFRPWPIYRGTHCDAPVPPGQLSTHPAAMTAPAAAPAP